MDSPGDKIGHASIVLGGPNGFLSAVGKWPVTKNRELGFDNVFSPIFGMDGYVLKEMDLVAENMNKYSFQSYDININQAQSAWKVIQDERRAVKNGESRYQLFTDQCATFACNVIKATGNEPPYAGLPKRPRKIYESINQD